MNLERTHHGILIDEKYLPALEALALLDWLTKERESLLLESQAEMPVAPVGVRLEEEWGDADVEEIKSEDEQIKRYSTGGSG